MKKIFFLLLPFVLILCTCEKNDDGPDSNGIISIPDTVFLYALIDEGVDTNGDSLISYAEAEAVKYLNFFRFLSSTISNATDLTGIEAFINLDTLSATNITGIRELDLSKLTKLKYLDVGGGACECGCSGKGSLQNINITKCALLETLKCDAISLTNLDVSKNTKLSYLDCSWNYISELDVSNNTAIEKIFCGINGLTNLNVSKNTSLTILSCEWNQIISLDVSSNTALVDLNCWDNELTELDVSNNSALKVLRCWGNSLISLDVYNNTALIGLDCSGNQLTILDISNCTQINNLRLTHMESLTKVCVWTTPFPPGGVEVATGESPNVYFTTDCSN